MKLSPSALLLATSLSAVVACGASSDDTSASGQSEINADRGNDDRDDAGPDGASASPPPQTFCSDGTVLALRLDEPFGGVIAPVA